MKKSKEIERINKECSELRDQGYNEIMSENKGAKRYSLIYHNLGKFKKLIKKSLRQYSSLQRSRISEITQWIRVIKIHHTMVNK